MFSSEYFKCLQDHHDEDNHDYDHEAFLGDEAEQFEELDPGNTKEGRGVSCSSNH